MLDDPLGLIVQGIAVLAAGMYPIGFLFGTCSACCNQCRNDTCEGFDLDEAFTKCRQSGTTYCSGDDAFEYIGDGRFAFGDVYLPYAPFRDSEWQELGPPAHLGQRVTGDGIAPGTQVVDGSHEIVTEAVLGECFETGVAGVQARLRDADRTWTRRYIITVSPVPANTPNCITFSGSGSLCGPWPSRPDNLENGYGEGVYGSGEGLDPFAEERRMCVRWLCRCYEGTGKRYLVQFTPQQITASASGGSGATFDVTVGEDGDNLFVQSITLLSGGTGYPVSGPIEFSGTGDPPATATFFCERLEPTVELSVDDFGFGESGASLTATLVEVDGSWSISGVNIVNGGTGYSTWNSISVSVTDGETEESAFIYIESVDEETGAITQVGIDPGGRFVKSGGVIQSVTLNSGGNYPPLGEPMYPDPADWYTVASTSETIGGPIVYGDGLAEKLEAADAGGSNWGSEWTYDLLEHEYLFAARNSRALDWQAADGDIACLVYAFVFYGNTKEGQYDKCNNATAEENTTPKAVSPIDLYSIHPCGRCMCG